MKKLKKRLLAFLLTAVMLLGNLLAVSAEDTGQTPEMKKDFGTEEAAGAEDEGQPSFMERVETVERAVIEQEGGDPDAVMHGARKARSIRKTVAEVLGMDGTKYMEWLYSHENDTYYLTTPYNPGWAAGSGMSADYRNPNGDCQGAYGAADTPGVPGMNCTGFVWHALMMPTAQSGGDVGMIPGISGWVTFYTNNDIERGYFQTKEEMLSSGYLEKGDIIWMFDESESTLSDYHHVGIYWGDGNQDSFWHSIDGASDGGGMPYDGNIISHIFAKSYNPFYVVVKTGGIEPKGGLEIQKGSERPDLTDGNDAYSLAGAVYGLYKDGVETARLTTDENGYAYADGIKPDSYILKEITAPYGYALDETEYPVTINSSQTTRQELTDYPQTDPVRVLLKKVDADTAQEMPQGSASLAGAEFTFKFYGVSSDTDPAAAGIEPLRTWVLKTRADGKTAMVDSLKVSGDQFFKNSNGDNTLPIGTVTIQETKAPKGYKLNPEVYVRQIPSEGSVEGVDTYNAPLVEETVNRGDIVVQKRDNETGDSTPQGSASLKGAEFTITSLNDNPVKVNGTAYTKGQVVKTIVTDEQGIAKTAGKELPYGSYQLKETKAPAGYKLSGVLTRDFTISTDGQVISFTAADNSIRDNVVRGGVKVQKRDNESGKNEPQGKAVLKGAEFTITSLNANPVKVNGVLYTKGQTVKTVIADANGIAQTRENELPFGTYRVTETKAPEGYQLSGVITRDFTIDADGQMVSLTAEDNSIRDNVIRGGVKVQKRDNETGKDKPQGGAVLKGAEFAVISRNDRTVIVNGTAYGSGQVVKTIVTDENGTAKTDAKELPYGSYTIRETKAPEGYNLSGVVSINFEIKEHGKTVELTAEDTSIRDDIIRGDVEIIKLKEIEDEDGDTFEGLKGVEFTFTSDTTGKVVKKIVTDKNGFATTTDKAHPRGGLVFDTYTVTETKCPDGLKPIEPFKVTIREEGVTLKGIYKEDKLIVSPVTVVKVDESTGKAIPVADTKFRLLDADKKPVAMTTHYPGTVVHETFKTDKNGQFTFPDKLKYGTYYLEELNAPEGYLKGELLEFKVTEGATWEKPLVVKYADENAMGQIVITKTSDDKKEKLPGAVFEIYAAKDIVTPDGTLRYAKGELTDTVTTEKDGIAKTKKLFLGKYDVKETKQPDGFILNEKTFHVTLEYKDQETAVVTEELAVTNKPTEIEIVKVDIDTKEPLEGVTFKIWNKEMESDTDPEMGVSVDYVTDADGKIHIERLVPGTYRIQETKSLPGYVLNEEIYEITIDPDGRVEGKDLGEITIKNVHTKLMGTTARDQDTGVQQAVPKKETVFIDTVKFQDLQIGETYIIKGKLMDKETGKPLLINDREVTGETTFTAEESDGMIDVKFVFDASALKGKELVVFEKVYIKDKEILAHEDLNDKDQTIEFPESEIGTQAKDQDTGVQQAVPKKETTFIDTVKYKNLIPGQEYTVKGVLMDKAAKKPLLIDNKEVTAEKTFIPEKPNGTVDVKFVFDASALRGQTTVVFEKLYIQGVEAAVHEDLNDKDQTIEFPESEIGTQAKDQDTGVQQAVPKKKTTFIDTVKYKNLIPGQEYTVKGVLMDKAAKKPLLIDGKEVTAEKTFIPEKPNGTVDVKFVFDASALRGQTTVVFEKLYIQGVEAAAHEDIEDKDQSIEFPEIEIRTKAEDKQTGTQEAIAKKDVVIVDTVTYKNLILGQEYTVKGVLMDSETGKPLLVKGKQVTAEKTFIPEKADGEVEVEFKLDASELKNKQTVIFEKLYIQGVEAAVHEDIEDKDQTITFKLGSLKPDLPENERTGLLTALKTGDMETFLPWILLMLVSVCGIAVIVGVKMKRKKGGQSIEDNAAADGGKDGSDEE